MKTLTTLLLAVLLCSNAPAQSDFITRWNLATAGSGDTQLIFGVGTSGTVSYSWQEVSPGTASGSGTFTGSIATISGLPVGAVIDLRIVPVNFGRIVIDGPDKNRLADVRQWGTTAWTSMASAFAGCSNLQITATDLPDLTGVTSMSAMFRECTILDGPSNIGSWSTANVTDMAVLFALAGEFNQPIGSWNTDNVTNMQEMFYKAASFNQPIGGWNTAKVEYMDYMFTGARAFNQPIGTLNTENVTSMGYMFSGATNFNQPIDAWNTTNVTDMQHMFSGALTFNQPIGTWNTAKVTTMYGMFQNTTAFNQPIGAWNTEKVTRMDYMFYSAASFNRPIDSWNTGNVTSMIGMFYLASAFSQSLGTWKLNASVDLRLMLDFSGLDCDHYSATLVGWSANPATPNTRSIGAFGRLYGTSGVAARTNLVSAKGWTITNDAASGADCLGAQYFVTRWNLATAGSGDTQLTFDVETSGTVSYTWQEVSPGTASGTGTFTGTTATISGLPAGAVIDLKIIPTNFNRIHINNGVDKDRLTDVSQWGTTAWSSMGYAFNGCSNLQISASDLPDLRNVTDIAGMFSLCTTLDGPTNIGDWNTANVTNMQDMFYMAATFNQPVGNWNTGNVTNMYMMFYYASAFNKSVGDWTLNAAANIDLMFLSSGLDCDHYSATLIGWNANPATPDGRTLTAPGMLYGTNAVAARNNLITNKGWTIAEDVASGSDCSGALPVTLVSFSGQKNSENQNILKWTTVDESNFERFEVQRSEDALSFEKIGDVYGRAVNMSAGPQSVPALAEYVFTDWSPGYFNYYRLKMIDLDGSYAYSRILAIENAGEQAFVGSFYPNPSSGKVRVDVSAPESGRWTLTVFDISGKSIAKRSYDLRKGKNTITLEHLAEGINLVRFEHGRFSEVRRLIRD